MLSADTVDNAFNFEHVSGVDMSFQENTSCVALCLDSAAQTYCKVQQLLQTVLYQT